MPLGVCVCVCVLFPFLNTHRIITDLYSDAMWRWKWKIIIFIYQRHRAPFNNTKSQSTKHEIHFFFGDRRASVGVIIKKEYAPVLRWNMFVKCKSDHLRIAIDISELYGWCNVTWTLNTGRPYYENDISGAGDYTTV